MTYKQLRSGDRLRVRGGSIDFSCCDCGLTHRLSFDRDVVVTVDAAPRSTAARRSGEKLRQRLYALTTKLRVRYFPK